MDLELCGDVVVVTGGANGIGLATAAAFAAEGARVVVVDREPTVNQAAERANAAAGIEVDVTDLASVLDTANKVVRLFGRCDHVVHAVGVGSGKFGFPFWKLEPGDWGRVLNVNLVGAVNVAHAFAPGMAARGSGTFLFVASVAGQIGSQTDPPYSASKAGLINFAQCAAKDLAPSGVRVNTVCPGMVKTTLNRAVYQSWAERQAEGDRSSYEVWADDKVKKLVPLNRWQTPEDVAAMAVFLASKRAMNVTGQTVNVDGGYVMHW